jgi:photosystem II stability/assembly factor-like uncharacterized protein
MLAVSRLVARKVAAALSLIVATGFVVTSAVYAQTTKPAGVWVNATSNVGGNKWGYAGITTMAAVPGTGQIIAGVSEAGLWGSEDGGKSWVKLGQSDVVQILNRPYQILFDPTDVKTFWETGNSDGPGLFKTTDGGKTFVPIGNVSGVDGIGIDFTDPQRKTLVIGHHEQPRSIEKSEDGGLSWLKIGQALPDNFNFSSDVLVFDANTMIVNAGGWKKDAAFGIFRTEDGGKTWTKVSDAGPSGIPCVTSDGAIYWQALWAKGLVKSSDQGKTWESIDGPVKDNPIELPDHKLLAFAERQLHVSQDGGKTWEKFGPEIPFKPSGICYDAKSRTLFAWRSTEAKEDNVIVKWEMSTGGS